MSPGTARLFFVAGACFLLGGGVGSYATRVIYGDEVGTVDPAGKPRPECPVSTPCPTCPPPVDCGELGPLPSDSAPSAILPGGEIDPVLNKPGLPASAIQLATKAVQSGVDPCLTSGETDKAPGLILLELTVTATGGTGFISEALVTQRSAGLEDEALEACIIDGAKAARFEWAQSEGEGRFKLPVKVAP